MSDRNVFVTIEISCQAFITYRWADKASFGECMDNNLHTKLWDIITRPGYTWNIVQVRACTCMSRYIFAMLVKRVHTSYWKIKSKLASTITSTIARRRRPNIPRKICTKVKHGKEWKEDHTKLQFHYQCTAVRMICALMRLLWFHT